MFFLYFALWVVLNGRWTTEIGLFGLVFAALAYAFTWKYMGYSPKMDFALLLRVPSAVSYGVNLVVEIIKANLTVTKMILSPEFVPDPQLVKFDVDLKKNRHLVALANSITLTPGTITVDLHDNHFVVHALDASLVDGLDDGGFVQQLMKMEEKHVRKQAAAVPELAAEETVTAMEQEAVDMDALEAEATENPETENPETENPETEKQEEEESGNEH